MPNIEPKVVVPVAVAIIRHKDEYLLSRRLNNKDFAGCWEFPGGKIEAGEQIEQALHRELEEELGIQLNLTHCQALIQIPYHYAHKSVLLHCWLCDDFSGQPTGKQGQEWAWFSEEQLGKLSFPPANRGILRALRLPPYYMITPDIVNTAHIAKFEKIILSNNNIRLVQLRNKNISPADYGTLAEKIAKICHQHHIKLLLNGLHNEELAERLGVGLHLRSQDLGELTAPPKINPSQFIGASCHNELEIKLAQAYADFLLLSPVFQPLSHDSSFKPLQWRGFEELAKKAQVPVYALGGMQISHLADAQAAGAQGIAAISTFWPKCNNR